jgi:hypothetical protein
MSSFPAPQAVPSQKKSSKIWIMVVVLLLCCLCSMAGMVGGYFYYQNNNAGISEIFDSFVQPVQPNAVKAGEEIRCEEGGYAFKTIPGYRVDSSSKDLGMYRLNPDDIDWGAPDYNYEEGPTIQLAGFIPTGDLSIEKYAKNWVDGMSARYQAVISDGPQVSVAGLNGIVYDFDYEIAGSGKIKTRDISVEVNPKQFMHILCTSTVEKWDKTLADCETVIRSITFFEPKPK